MADPAATTAAITYKTATCPSCSEERTYYLDTGGKPIPIETNLNEIHEAKVVLDVLQATSASKKSVDVSTEAWTVDDYVDKIVQVLDAARGKVTQQRSVKSNTATSIKLKGKFKRTNNVSAHIPGDPFLTLPYFRIVDPTLVVTPAVVKTKLRDLYLFVCALCNTRYTVDKP